MKAPEGFPGDKPIAMAKSSTTSLIATTSQLFWEEADQWRSLPWHEIARAFWSSESGEFVVEPMVGPRLLWTLVEAGQLPEAARERITSTIIATDTTMVPGVGSVQIIFRKVGDQIQAQTLPAVDRSLISARIAQVSAELGIG